MDAADEPYDFLNWHSNAPVVKDEKKELVIPPALWTIFISPLGVSLLCKSDTVPSFFL